MEGRYVINLLSFLNFVINKSTRLRFDVQIILCRKHLKIKRPVMVISFPEISWCSLALAVKNFSFKTVVLPFYIHQTRFLVSFRMHYLYIKNKSVENSVGYILSAVNLVTPCS